MICDTILEKGPLRARTNFQYLRANLSGSLYLITYRGRYHLLITCYRRSNVDSNYVKGSKAIFFYYLYRGNGRNGVYHD